VNGAVLLAANYDNRVGYAWHNIYELFNALARDFTARGVRVCVSFPSIAEPLTLFDADLTIDAFALDMNDLRPARLGAVTRALRARGVTRLYLTDRAPVRPAYAALRAAGVRRIVVHNRISVPDPHPAQPDHGPRRWLKWLSARVPFAGVDRVFAVSDFVRNRLVARNGLPPSRVRTILNGIDVARWQCAPPEPARDPVVFFAGSRAARYKGILVLIEAAHLLRTTHGHEGFRLRYAGDGPDLALFRDAVERYGLQQHVTLLGRLEDTKPEVCAADAVIVPSMYGDACPSSVSEALASGRALITTRAGGIPELVGDPDNARIVPPGDAAALAAAMAGLVAEPAERLALGRRGRARAEHALEQAPYHRAVAAALREEFDIA
jgi:glycosyltransferase involved in cell wall biosynthesis